MRVRFQADADLRCSIVRAVRRKEPAIDFRTANEAGLEALSDEEVLVRAAAERRLLVSHDRRTMPRHFAAFVAQSHSPGVILVSQNMPVRQVAEDLVLIWEASEAEEWTDVILALPL